METGEQINKFQEFFEKYYEAQLAEKVRKGDKVLVVEFPKISEFNPELANLLLDKPDDTLKAASYAVERFDFEGDTKSFAIRIKDLPSSQRILIKDVRSKNLNQFLWIEGIVRQKSDVRPQVTLARFECPSCGNIISVLQLDNEFREPSRCACGRKGKFKMGDKELIDAQGLKLEETPEDLDGGEQPKRLNVFLKNDLVSPMSEKRNNPGAKVRLFGVIKEVPIIMRSGKQGTRYDLIFEANYFEGVQEEFGDLIISKEELQQIEDLSQDPLLMKKLVNSIAPGIYGHDKIKEALLLQLAGGIRKVKESGSVTRGDMHVLLIGDPGSGKSQMLKRVFKVAPKARYVSGKGASGAGLTASVVKDEFLQGWSLEAGALVLANRGLCCIDELDKMSKDDTSAMHEALEQQTVTISKANIQATLHTQTTVLAAANPKFGRFDPYETVAKQIELPVTLINRFDLIFAIKDLPDKEKDERLASFILDLHKDDNDTVSDISTDLLRKYLAHCKTIYPKLTDSAIAEIKDYYLKMRSSGEGSGGKSIPISPRQLEGLIRLAESSARLRLSNKVTKKDAQKAVELLDYCLRQIAFDEETGTIDIDRIGGDMPASQRNKIIGIKEIIAELESKIGKTIPVDDVIESAKEHNINAEIVEEALEKLKRMGDIFEPKRGFIQRM